MSQPGVWTRPKGTANDQQIVAIVSVDVIGLKAQGRTRHDNNYVQIDLRYMAGSIHVIPSVGDQWMVKWQGQGYVLVSQLPYNGTELSTVADNPVQGTVQIGSTNPSGQGPLHLNGSLVSANAPLNLAEYTTATRPDPTTCPNTMIWNTTVGEIETSNGTSWSPLTGSGGSGPATGTAGQSVFGEPPTGARNGTNVTFTTSSNFAPNSTSVFRNGIRELLNVTYTETAPNKVVFSTAPLVDDVVIVDYLGPTTITAQSIFGEVPTGIKNGNNKVFTLAHNFVSSSVQVYRNALRESNPANFSETLPNQITFVTAPLSNDDLTVDYLTNG